MANSEQDMVVKFLSKIPSLPAELPTGWPHIIDLASSATRTSVHMKPIPDNVNLLNAVPTLLYYHNLEFLRKFLDLAIEKVTFIGHPTNGTSDLHIERKGNRITVG